MQLSCDDFQRRDVLAAIRHGPPPVLLQETGISHVQTYPASQSGHVSLSLTTRELTSSGCKPACDVAMKSNSNPRNRRDGAELERQALSACLLNCLGPSLFFDSAFQLEPLQILEQRCAIRGRQRWRHR